MEALYSLMHSQIFVPASLALAAALVFLAAVFCAGLKIGSVFGSLRAERLFERKLESGRTDAVKRSRAVLAGQLSEQLAPWLPNFPFDPTEVRFVGKPVDFIAFTGASKGRIEEVVLVEVKSGESRLSPVELSLKRAVEEGRVRYVEYRVPEGRGSRPAAQSSS